MNPHAESAGNPALILVVDDSPTQAKLLEHVLTEQGYQVSVAENGREAFSFLTSQKPDLVISDILMPEMDGFELCRRIRQTEGLKSLPIVLLSLLNDAADVLRSLEAGANYFISKPCSSELLLSRVRQILDDEEPGRFDAAGAEVEVRYHGQVYSIHARKSQIIDLLIATYETAVEKNQELLTTQRELRGLNLELEKRVMERTAALTAETSERLRAMEELREKDRMLMQQNRQAAMGEMIGNIAHQWRQPLNAVGLLVQGIPMTYQHGGLNQEYLDDTSRRIMQLIQHMSQTIDDFRNFFMPDKEKVTFKVCRLVARTLALFEGNFSDKRIVVELITDADPEVTGYPNEFAQVLLNILNNAQDAFLERKTTKPLIKIRVFTENGKAVVTLTDNAGGIREEILDRIFEPYFSTKEQGKGTGVGLYMAKNIIEKSMNGDLTVRNTGQGAEFRIET